MVLMKVSSGPRFLLGFNRLVMSLQLASNRFLNISSPIVRYATTLHHLEIDKVVPLIYCTKRANHESSQRQRETRWAHKKNISDLLFLASYRREFDVCSALLIGAQRAKTNVFFFFLIHGANERGRSKNRINKNGDCTKEIARWALRSLLFSQPAEPIFHTHRLLSSAFYASGSCRVGGNIAICVYV